MTNLCDDLGRNGWRIAFSPLVLGHASAASAPAAGEIRQHANGLAPAIHAPDRLSAARSDQIADGEVDIAGQCQGLEDEWQQYWGWCISIVGPLRYIADFPPFPNAHIRSNGFIVERKWLTEHFPSAKPTKYAAYGFESGFRGLSKAVIERGRQLAIVDRRGNVFPPDRWHESETFRLGSQDGLIMADNQTRAFDAMPEPERDLHRMMSWGRERVEAKSVPSLGLPFGKARGLDFQGLKKTDRDTAPRKIYRYFLEAIRNLR